MKNILSPKILIVDNNIDYLKYMQMIFIEKNYLAYIALNIAEAMALTHEKIPDCIIIDYNMPYNGAANFAKKIKEDKLLQDTPIIFVTALDVKDIYINALKNGADDYLPKSVDLDTLFARIDALLRHKSALEANRNYIDMLKMDIRYAARVQEIILKRDSVIPKQSEVATLYKPAGEVSGDYYDIIRIDKSRYVIILSDVAGHGVAASMLTILIKSFFESNIQNEWILRPAKFLSELNNFFLAERFENGFFSTAFYGIYNDETSEMHYARAGSPLPFLYVKNENKIIEIDAEGALIGMSADSEFEEKTITFGKSDVLFLFTDGAYEVFDKNHVQLGEDNLKDIFSKTVTLPINEMLGIIYKNINEYSNNTIPDDLTMIVMRKL